MRILFALTIFLIPVTVLAWPWSTDMMNQPSIKPQETHDGKIYNFPARSVPVGGIPTRVSSREEAQDMVNPIKADAHSLKKGERLFKIYCSACHGLDGKASSPVSDKIGAVDLTMEHIRNYTDGFIWGTITFGSVVMPAYGRPAEGGGSNDLSPEERWHVVNYVRHGVQGASPATTVAETKQ